MSFNGAGLFQINTAGQPVVFGTAIDETVFNAFTADIATGLSTCITKNGQTTITANIPMSSFKFTGLALGSAYTDSARVDNANALNMCEFRLTLTTAVPVTTSDVTAAETLYWTPYRGNRVALYDGSVWHMRTITELSIDVPDVTSMHDVFVYDNAGTPALEVLAWTNDTTRATALTLQDGVLSKTGALTRRYVGSFYSTTAGNGQIEDSFANRYLWNYYNRVCRPMRAIDTTDTWNYSTATIRQANANTANQLNFCVGYSEDLVQAQILVYAANTTVVAERIRVGIGLDVTNAFTTGGIYGEPNFYVANLNVLATASIKLFPGVGKHFLSWNEWSTAGGTTTWKGDNGGTGQSGIHGEIWG